MAAQLHLELIKASEAVDAQRDEYDHQRRTTNEKLRELEFLSTHQQRVIQQQDERINKLLEEVRAMKLERGANSTIVNRREIELTAYLAEAPSRPTASAGALPRSRRGSTGNASTASSATFNVPTGNMDDAVLVVELRREIAIVRERADAAAAETADDEQSQLESQERWAALRRLGLEKDNLLRKQQQNVEAFDEGVYALRRERLKLDADLKVCSSVWL